MIIFEENTLQIYSYLCLFFKGIREIASLSSQIDTDPIAIVLKLPKVVSSVLILGEKFLCNLRNLWQNIIEFK